MGRRRDHQLIPTKSIWRLLRRIDQCVRRPCSLPPLGAQIAGDGRPTTLADWPAATSSLMRTSISHPLQIAVARARIFDLEGAHRQHKQTTALGRIALPDRSPPL
jgi:hypothetical protein